MMVRTVFYLLLLFGLPACAELQQLQQQPGPFTQHAVEADVVHWLEAAQLIRESSPDRQQQLLEDWEAAFHDQPLLGTRMQLVLLYATSAEQLRDRMRARRLLNGIDPLPEATADREFIALLLQILEDQGQSVRKLDILWKQVTTQNRRIEELEQQLQALTNIEKNIQSRELPAVE